METKEVLYALRTEHKMTQDELIEVCVKNMAKDELSEEQARSSLKEKLPKLDYWKRYRELGDNGEFGRFKKQLIDEINALHIEGMPKAERLNAPVGQYVNFAYRLPGGACVKFLNDQTTCLGNQLACEFDEETCFGVLANMDFIMVCTYKREGADPELILYKKR